MDKKIINGIEYTLDEVFAVIWGFTPEIPEYVVIPGRINGTPVKLINYEAFLCCHTLKHIIIPESVTYIGDCAFWSCPDLKAVHLPKLKVKIRKALFFADSVPAVFFKGTKEEFKNMFEFDICKFGIAYNNDGYRINVTTHCSDGDLIC